MKFARSGMKSVRSGMDISRLFVFPLILVVLLNNSRAEGISCYACSSKNGSDVNCEDPYHPAFSTFVRSCEVPKENHIGTFPANFCVKIIGKSAVTSESLVIRTCVLENMDSQCGVFKFGDEQLNGCILSCEIDGCNHSLTLSRSLPLLLLSGIVFLFNTTEWKATLNQ